jgi:hypothetical protein
MSIAFCSAKRIRWSIVTRAHVPRQVAGLTGGDALRDRRRKLNRRLQARRRGWPSISFSMLHTCLEEELISR